MSWLKKQPCSRWFVFHPLHPNFFCVYSIQPVDQSINTIILSAHIFHLCHGFCGLLEINGDASISFAVITAKTVIEESSIFIGRILFLIGIIVSFIGRISVFHLHREDSVLHISFFHWQNSVFHWDHFVFHRENSVFIVMRFWFWENPVFHIVYTVRENSVYHIV